jgi:hypothetical protein
MIIAKLANYILGLLKAKPVRLAIVRRYCDANGSFVGELYLEQEQSGVSSYRMIGASLDTLPLDMGSRNSINGYFSELDKWLDTTNDFLVPMPLNTLRVGALDPKDNDRVRRMVARLPRRSMTLVVQNRFIEHILEKPKA